MVEVFTRRWKEVASQINAHEQEAKCFVPDAVNDPDADTSCQGLILLLIWIGNFFYFCGG